jgi:hypothetical protein
VKVAFYSKGENTQSCTKRKKKVIAKQNVLFFTMNFEVVGPEAYSTRNIKTKKKTKKKHQYFDIQRLCWSPTILFGRGKKRKSTSSSNMNSPSSFLK